MRTGVLVSPDARPDASLYEMTVVAAEAAVSEDGALVLLPAGLESRPRVATPSGDSVPMAPEFIVIPTAMPAGRDSVALAVRVTDVETGAVLASERRISGRREAGSALRAMTRATLAIAVRSKKERR